MANQSKQGHSHRTKNVRTLIENGSNTHFQDNTAIDPRVLESYAEKQCRSLSSIPDNWCSQRHRRRADVHLSGYTKEQSGACQDLYGGMVLALRSKLFLSLTLPPRVCRYSRWQERCHWVVAPSTLLTVARGIHCWNEGCCFPALEEQVPQGSLKS